MFVFGFYLEKEIVIEELLRRMSSEWASQDKYWDHRPSEAIDIVIFIVIFHHLHIISGFITHNYFLSELCSNMFEIYLIISISIY
jgi:hypothetical protein